MIIAVKLHEITTSCKYVLYINDFLINNWCGMVMYSLRGGVLKNKRTYSGSIHFAISEYVLLFSMFLNLSYCLYLSASSLARATRLAVSGCEENILCI